MSSLIYSVLIVVATVAAAGLLLKFVIPWLFKYADWEISWREFIAGMLVSCVLVTSAVFGIGSALSTADLLQHEQFANGVETEAIVTVEECFPGQPGTNASSGHSNCHYEYQTDQTYEYTEHYLIPITTCTSNGKTVTCSTIYVPAQRQVTAYIYNPYGAREYNYAITDSLGGQYDFPGPYVKDGESYQDNAMPADIPRGDPAEWVESQQRLNEGDPRAVTRLVNYDNYVLASQDGTYGDYTDEVEEYLKQDILPDHTAKISDDPLHGFNGAIADKVSFVGVGARANGPSDWQDSLMSFNGALGSKYGGDLHLVFIDASLVDDPTMYLGALKAYWQSDDFGRRAIGANAIIVVAGVQNNVIQWAVASTGMPSGNDTMLQSIQRDLTDVPFTPAAVLGSPKTVVSPDTAAVRVSLSETPGVLEKIILRNAPFEKPCMECYAKAEIQPKWWQWMIMIITVFIISLVLWFVAGRVELFVFRRKDGRDREWERRY